MPGMQDHAASKRKIMEGKEWNCPVLVRVLGGLVVCWCLQFLRVAVGDNRRTHKPTDPLASMGWESRVDRFDGLLGDNRVSWWKIWTKLMCRRELGFVEDCEAGDSQTADSEAAMDSKVQHDPNTCPGNLGIKDQGVAWWQPSALLGWESSGVDRPDFWGTTVCGASHPPVLLQWNQEVTFCNKQEQVSMQASNMKQNDTFPLSQFPPCTYPVIPYALVLSFPHMGCTCHFFPPTPPTMSAQTAPKALTNSLDIQMECRSWQAFVHCVVVNDMTMGGRDEACFLQAAFCAFFIGCAIRIFSAVALQ